MAPRYVRATGGTDSGEAATFGAGWATLEYAFDNVDAGDILYICSNVSNKFTISAKVDIDTTSGTATNRIQVLGADLVDGSPYNGAGFAYITTASTITALWDIADAMHYYFVKDIYFDGGGSGNASYCVQNPAAGNTDVWEWDNCRFTNASSHGLYLFVRGDVDGPWHFNGCEIDSNGKGGSGNGVGGPTANRILVNYNNCIIRDNADYGVRTGIASQENTAYFTDNVVYRNGGSGLHLVTAAAAQIKVSGSVFFDNGGSGLEITASDDLFVVAFENNIFSENDVYGIDTNGGTVNQVLSADYNCYYDNGSGHIDILSGTPPGTHNVTSDPKFVNTTAGSEDFGLQSGSPCLGAALGYVS